MVVKVYGPTAAACPQRVMACLLEKGVEFEVIHVDLEAGEQKRPEFLARQVNISMTTRFSSIIIACMLSYEGCASFSRGAPDSLSRKQQRIHLASTRGQKLCC